MDARRRRREGRSCPGTTARPKSRPAAADTGQASAAATPTQSPVLRQDHAPARPSASRERRRAARGPRRPRRAGGGLQESGAGDRFLQRGANAGERTGVGGGRAQRHPENRQQRSDVAGAQLVPDARRTPSRPAHRGAEEEPADDRGEERQRQFGRTGEARREDRRQQEELNRHGEAQRLDLRPLAFERAAEAGVHAERPALRAVAEGRPHHERAEQGRARSRRVSRRPPAGRWARHSATPSPSATAR